jgi:hypothetical protein
MFQCISMCLNVFLDIVIGISPSHSHCNIFAMHTHLHFLFILHNDSLPNMLYHYIFIFPFPLISSNFHTIYEKNSYQFLLFTFIHHHTFHVPHSTFHVVTGCAEHSKAQVCCILVDCNTLYHITISN